MNLHSATHRLNMRTRLRQGGNTLVITMVLLGIVVISLASYLTLISAENRFAVRSQTWNEALPLAEAGIEEAFMNLNIHGTNQLANSTNKWTRAGAIYWVSRSLGSGRSYSVSIDAGANPLTITSSGTVPLPGVIGNGSLSRQVQVLATNNPTALNAISVKGKITLSGSAYVDSYNSSDTNFSTGGRYDPAKRRQNGNIATDSSAKPAVKSSSSLPIYGNIQTGPGGTVLGLHTGTVTDDMNVQFADAKLPDGFSGVTANPGTVGGTNYTYVLNGNVQMTKIQLSSGQKVIVNAPNTVVYLTGDLVTSGSAFIYIQPGASVSFYIGGKVALSGGAVMNGSTTPSTFQLYGLNTCTSIDLSASTAMTGICYAPYANITFSGSAGWSGCFTGNSFTMSGSSGIHFDESLLNLAGTGYTMIAWKEL